MKIIDLSQTDKIIIENELLNRAHFFDEQGLKKDHWSLNQWLNLSDSYCLFINQIDFDGFILMIDQIDSWHLLKIIVNKSQRERGIAQTMLESLISFTEKEKPIHLEVRESNKSAISLYKKLGFQEVRSIPRCYSDGERGIGFMYTPKVDFPMKNC